MTQKRSVNAVDLHACPGRATQLELLPCEPPPRESFAASASRVCITVLTTERCCFRCRHCLYACSPSKPKAYVSDGVLQEVAQALKVSSTTESTPVLNLLGGEPTMDFDELERVINWVLSLPRSSFLLSMVTNGWWLQSLKATARFAQIFQKVWMASDDVVRISISNSIWHDPFRTPRVLGMLADGDLAQVLQNLQKWHSPAVINGLSHEQRAAIEAMAKAAVRGEIYIQRRTKDSWYLISMGRAETYGYGHSGHFCSPEDLTITVWPDGSIRHICDGPGKITFGRIGDGIETIWGLRAAFIRRVHKRFPVQDSALPQAYNSRCQRCRQYAGYWLDQEKPRILQLAA